MARKSYVFLVTLTKNTTDEKSFKKSDAISGRIKKITMDIPSGWGFAAGFKLKFGEHISLPSVTKDSEAYFTGDDINLPIEPDIELTEDRIEIVGINNDATNDHSFVVTIEVEE